MATTEQKLIAKVEAVNLVRAARKKIYDAYLPIVSQFVGQKVVLKTGGASKKFRDALPKDVCPELHRIYVTCGSYSIRVELTACVQCGEVSCTYHEESVYLADIEGGVITQVYEPEKEYRQFTVEEIRNLRAELSAANKVVSDIESRLFPFGEYDN